MRKTSCLSEAVETANKCFSTSDSIVGKKKAETKLSGWQETGFVLHLDAYTTSMF